MCDPGLDTDGAGRRRGDRHRLRRTTNLQNEPNLSRGQAHSKRFEYRRLQWICPGAVAAETNPIEARSSKGPTPAVLRPDNSAEKVCGVPI